MARQKKTLHGVEMIEGKQNTIRQLLEEYDIETAVPSRKWMGTSDMKKPSVLIMMIIVTGISVSRSIVVTIMWQLKYRRSVNQPLNHRL